MVLISSKGSLKAYLSAITCIWNLVVDTVVSCCTFHAAVFLIFLNLKIFIHRDKGLFELTS